MATDNQQWDDWTVVLRRQPARIVNGHAEGPYADAFEVICCHCGDDPGLEHTEFSPELQLVRGPYSIIDGFAAHETHLKMHHQAETAHPEGAMTMLSLNTIKNDWWRIQEEAGIEHAPHWPPLTLQAMGYQDVGHPRRQAQKVNRCRAGCQRTQVRGDLATRAPRRAGICDLAGVVRS